MEISLNGSDWKCRAFWPVVGRRSGYAEDPSRWQNATVPGCAQRDALAAGLIADPYVDFKSRDAEWVSNKEWVYVKTFTPDAAIEGKRVRIRFEGVDYSADFFLNGERIGSHENLFLPVEFDVSDKLKFGEENTLAVAVHPAPPEQAQMGWTSKVRTMKPRFCYQWDFATQLVPVGIWQDVKLLVNDDARLTDCWVRAIPSDDLKSGEARIEMQIEAGTEMDAAAEVVLFDRLNVTGRIRALRLKPGANKTRIALRVPNVRLWWPNGSGEQNLYQAHVRLLNKSGKLIDEREVTFGFKRARLLQNPGVPDHVPPFSLEVNDRRTYIKGWNWVPLDHMYGGDLSAKYERMLKLAREANVNLIRIWGGGLIETETFYRLCDELGIMVWQEFTLSSSAMESVPSTRPEYLRMLREAAKKIVPLRRNHASLTIWCGGNELIWTGAGDPAMATLHAVCARLDPDKPFAPTSPLSAHEDKTPEKDTHGHWLYGGLEDHYKLYNGLRACFHSEFGCEGAANLENVPRFIKNEELWPPDRTNEIWLHRGDWWVNYDKLCGYFGPIHDLPTFARLSQFIQWEGLRYIVEANRRRKHACGGSIPWQYNEPWPNLSCTNAVDFYGTPKMAYYGVAKAYEPVHVSAKYDKLAWKAGETFSAELWVSNSLQDIAGASVEAEIADMQGKICANVSLPVDIPANSSVPAGSIEWRLPAGFEEVFILTVRLTDAAGGVRSENVYVFGTAPDTPLSSLMSLPQTRIEVSSGDYGLRVANKGGAFTMFVRLRPRDLDADIYFSDNYLVIPPGGEKMVSVRSDFGVAYVICEGWNTNEETSS
ncbi:MAG: glycoside hydrolase family 2 TIM barrel-domain containing protein [Armatimonadota bacterium]|nr:glycoside hydrolase family 2 TIM barrel-domain containing protein [Armatimonadota bacterium]